MQIYKNNSSQASVHPSDHSAKAPFLEDKSTVLGEQKHHSCSTIIFFKFWTMWTCGHVDRHFFQKSAENIKRGLLYILYIIYIIEFRFRFFPKNYCPRVHMSTFSEKELHIYYTYKVYIIAQIKDFSGAFPEIHCFVKYS